MAQNPVISNSQFQNISQNDSTNFLQNYSTVTKITNPNSQNNSVQKTFKLLKAGSGTSGKIAVLKMTDCDLLISNNKRYLNPFRYNPPENTIKYNDNNPKLPIINFTHFVVAAGRSSDFMSGRVDFVQNRTETIITFIASIGNDTKNKVNLYKELSLWKILKLILFLPVSIKK